MTWLFILSVLVGTVAVDVGLCTEKDSSCAAVALGISASIADDAAVELLQKSMGHANVRVDNAQLHKEQGAEETDGAASPPELRPRVSNIQPEKKRVTGGADGIELVPVLRPMVDSTEFEEQDIEVTKDAAMQTKTDFNATKIWSQFKAAVGIDRLKAQIQKTTDSDNWDQLQHQLAQLRRSFPGAEVLKRRFSDQWDNITKAIDVENNDDDLNDASHKSSDLVDPTQSVEAIKNQAAEKWAYLQDHGVSLPDLDVLTDQAEELAKNAVRSWQQAWNSTHAVWNSTADTWKDTLKGWGSSARGALDAWLDRE